MSKKPGRGYSKPDPTLPVEDQPVHKQHPLAHADDLHSGGLEGLGFRVYGEGGAVDRSGVIRSELSGGHYLIEYEDGTDARDDLAVVHIGKFVEPSGDRHGAGCWCLYERD